MRRCRRTRETPSTAEPRAARSARTAPRPSSSPSPRSGSCCFRTASRCGTSSSRATSKDRATPASRTWCRRTSSASLRPPTSAPSSATAARPGGCTSGTCSGRWGLPRTCCLPPAPRTPHGRSNGLRNAGTRSFPRSLPPRKTGRWARCPPRTASNAAS